MNRMDKENIILRIGELVSLPFKYKIVGFKDGSDMPHFLEDKSNEEISKFISNMRGWARMVLNNKIVIKKLTDK